METSQQTDLDKSLKQGEEYVNHVVSEIQDKIKEGEERITKTIGEVDKRLRENPWPIVAGVAAASIFIGFLVGSRKK